MESKLAKALYDNTAECSDELAFHKGDVVTVMQQNVEGTSGWWMCSLYGRQGLAPANRLQLLPLQRWSSPSRLAQKAKSVDCPNGDSPHNNIYQIPSALRPPAAAAPPHDGGDLIYKVPSTPLNAPRSPPPSATLKFSPEGPEGIKASISVTSSSHRGEVYDIPNQARRTSLFTASTAPRQLVRKASLSTASELERRFSPEDSVRCSDSMYAVPPAPSQDPSYDIPVPSSNEAQQRMLISGYNTLPTPRKPEWIYDVPVSPEKPGSYGTMPSKVLGRAWPAQSCLYDIPKAGSCLQQSQDSPSPPAVLPRAPVYSRQPAQEQVYAVPPNDSLALHREGHREHVPLECRGEPPLGAYDHARVHLQRTRKLLVPVKGRAGSVGSSQLQEEEDDDRSTSSSSSGSQRSSTSSTTSSSSSSSCDSLALSSSSSSSSSPEPPMRQVTLGQGEAGRRLLDLQEGVCRAAPRLMEFVSSRWRRREHLEEHLDAIREAAEAVACSLTRFVNFALDVKGNACRLTDANLQARIHKQLSVVADSGVILQQTVNALGAAGWPLDALSQDPAQAQTPDQLERFVMVARTVPEDVKRLVSILNANGKLLFRPTQTETGAAERPHVHTSAKSSQQQGPDLTEVRGHVHTSPDPTEDDNDYVQLQTKSDYETQQKKVQGDLKENTTVSTNKNIQADQKRRLSERRVVATSEQQQKQPSLSEHCRLYFGALQKAIGGLVGSLLDSQPPERFISHSKLVIMVGQRLVDTLCREAHNSTTSGSSSQSLLCKSNHLCALLKQLAVATKKAALRYPDRQALLEAQDFAAELAQRAQHFRISLDL